jgi:uncharacterized protein
MMNGDNIISIERNVLNAGDSPTLKEQLLEVLTFCFLIVPALAFSFVAGPALHENFLVGVLGVVLSDLALVALILFFLWHNNESISRIGWISNDFFKEFILGILLFIPFVYLISVIEPWLQSSGLSFPKGHIPSFLKPTLTSQKIIVTGLIVIVAICEETIFRGYLILRFKSITGSSAIAVILSSIIFSIGHGYEGFGGAVVVGIMGAIFAIVFLWRKSLIAPMVMHFLQDFIAIIYVSKIVTK